MGVMLGRDAHGERLVRIVSAFLCGAIIPDAGCRSTLAFTAVTSRPAEDAMPAMPLVDGCIQQGGCTLLGVCSLLLFTASRFTASRSMSTVARNPEPIVHSGALTMRNRRPTQSLPFLLSSVPYTRSITHNPSPISFFVTSPRPGTHTGEESPFPSDRRARA